LPVKLTTTITHISSVPNPTNRTLLQEFHQYMKSIGTSDSYQNGNLKIMIYLDLVIRGKGLDSQQFLVSSSRRIPWPGADAQPSFLQSLLHHVHDLIELLRGGDVLGPLRAAEGGKEQ
jgi:hypothetical protein